MNQKVLLLDVSYLPIKTIRWEKALSLFFNGKVEVVEEFDIDLRSPCGDVYRLYKNQRQFAHLHNLNPGALNKLVSGVIKIHRGWRLNS